MAIKNEEGIHLERLGSVENEDGKLQEKLFEPGRRGKLSLKNRIVMSPMGITGLLDYVGRLSQRGVDYYVARARGGVGLIITGHFRIVRWLFSLLPHAPDKGENVAYNWYSSQFPLNTASLFSRKAWAPSAASSVFTAIT